MSENPGHPLLDNLGIAANLTPAQKEALKQAIEHRALTGLKAASGKKVLEVDVPDHYTLETRLQVEKLLSYMREYAQLFASKQEAYGRGNIDGFGELGVLVRLNDKLERLKNLVYKQRSNDMESVRDTWLDIVGYGLIGLMVHDGVW